MAATDPHPPHLAYGATEAQPSADERSSRDVRRPLRCLSSEELHERIEEEVARATRYGGELSCLLMRLDHYRQIAEDHGAELAERALMHAGETLCAQLRSFDRVGRPRQDELVIVLPGAADTGGEAVARRALGRLRAIKIEVDQMRQPLCVSVGIATWQAPWSAGTLLEEARAAAELTGQDAER